MRVNTKYINSTIIGVISMILFCTYVLCIIPCYLPGIFYAVIRKISMLFIDNKISVFCIPEVHHRGSSRRCSLCTLYLHACQVRVTVGDSGLCCCTCVTYFERQLPPLRVDHARALWASFCFRFATNQTKNLSSKKNSTLF